jgi:DNA-binding response OmpR family regulator
LRILPVDDEVDLSRAVSALLRAERYDVRWAPSIDEAYLALAENEPDLIVLDVMFPESEDAGFDFASALRETHVGIPILFLTARDAIEDRVEGLDLGGDDYLAKPFHAEELLARVRALLRRDGEQRTALLERGPLQIDFRARTVSWDGAGVELSDREFSLLETLALHPERAYPVQELAERHFPNASSGTYVVRTYVFRLRSKLAPDAIRTLPGGYRLGVP